MVISGKIELNLLHCRQILYRMSYQRNPLYDTGFTSPPCLAKHIDDSRAQRHGCVDGIENVLPSSRGGALLTTGFPGKEVG